jgi:hypothetical protein
MAVSGGSRLRLVGPDDGSTLQPPDGGGTSGGMASAPPTDLHSRVGRLEMGFCAACVLIFSAIIGSYLLMANKFDAVGDRVGRVEVAVGQLQAKATETDRRLDRMDAKLDTLLERIPAKR